MITGQTVKNIYQGDGSNRVWNISFDFTDSSQIKFKVNGEEIETNFALNTVAKTLTYPTVASELDPLTSADEIEIYRDTSITQDIEFNNGGPLNANMIEDGLDKLTMIAQELKDKVGKKSNVNVLPDGADIDSLKEEGEYFIQDVSCSSGFPSDLVTTVERYGQVSIEGKTACVKVIPTVTEGPNGYPTVKVTQVVLFYTYVNVPDKITSFSGAYIRTFNDGDNYPASWGGWENIINAKRTVFCGANSFIPTKMYPNTTYFLGANSYTEFADYVAMTSLTLSNLPDSPSPIEIYFKTGNSFSGITATQIKGWIGSTSLDTDSVYKITISNLIAKIEKVTV